jgi:uncharacterized protein YjbJ (UPF0337 family)
MTDNNAPYQDSSEDELTDRGLSDSIEGKTTRVKGKAEDALGALTGNLQEQAKGKMDQVKGGAQDILGKLEREAGEAKYDEAEDEEL